MTNPPEIATADDLRSAASYIVVTTGGLQRLDYKAEMDGRAIGLYRLADAMERVAQDTDLKITMDRVRMIGKEQVSVTLGDFLVLARTLESLLPSLRQEGT